MELDNNNNTNTNNNNNTNILLSVVATPPSSPGPAPVETPDEPQTFESSLLQLEDHLIDTLDALKSSSSSSSVDHPETLIQSILEIVLHHAQALCSRYDSNNNEGLFVEVVYERLSEQIVLPTLLEMAQCDAKLARRCAAMKFFHMLYSALQQQNMNMDDFPRSKMHTILRYWMQCVTACLAAGVFTAAESESVLYRRAILSGNSAIRPVLRSIAQCIAAADDTGAMALYAPLMYMLSRVLKIWLQEDEVEEDVRAACIKVLETVVLCCTSQDTSPSKGQRQRKTNRSSKDDVSLKDIPNGHPVITRDALESMGHYSFVVLRGLVEVSGQVALASRSVTTSNKAQDEYTAEDYLQIIKPAALAFLELDTNRNADNTLSSDLEVAFYLLQKSYAVTTNAVAIIAVNRISCFPDAAAGLARRTMMPFRASNDSNGTGLTSAAAVGIQAQIRATCLTLLRNPYSVTTNSADLLLKALHQVGMTVQADKAHNVAKQQAALKTASRRVRNRAAVFYEWDSSTTDQLQVNKRQRETEDELAKLRAAKVARGLGNGIHLPRNLIEGCELVLLNLQHLPTTRPTKKSRNGSVTSTINLEYIIDAVLSSGASLQRDAARWYDRDGGAAWSRMEFHADSDKNIFELTTALNEQIASTEKVSTISNNSEILYSTQCQQAAADALYRVVSYTDKHNSALVQLRQKLCARLAWTMQGIEPTRKQSNLYHAHSLVTESLADTASIVGTSNANGGTADEDGMCQKLLTDYPMVAACLGLEYANTSSPYSVLSSVEGANDPEVSSTLLIKNIILEGHLMDYTSSTSVSGDTLHTDIVTEMFISIISHVCRLANDKPTDLGLKKVASIAQKTFPIVLDSAPTISESTLRLLCSLCDIDTVHKNLAEVTRKNSSTIAASAAAHAATSAAEKRATTTLLALRDIAFQRTKKTTRQAAVSCAVSLATGYFPSPASVQDKALKLVMNLLFPKSPILADMVVASATNELERAANYAIDNHAKVEKVTNTLIDKSTDVTIAISDEEALVVSKIKPISELFMALCVRRPDAIMTLMKFSCRPNADILLKAVKNDISRMARALSTAYGAASIALKVSQMATLDESPMLFAFLDNLSSRSPSANPPSQALIDACFQIQKDKSENGKLDPRFIIPVVSAIARSQLIEFLPKFIEADDDVYKAALLRMSERLARENLTYRDQGEAHDDQSILKGMTRCEQIIYLHKLDFKAVGLPQKRYLDAIKLCLEMEEIFTDRVLHAALDFISQQFLLGEATLPLAYMRTIIIVCQRHETLHNWFCSELLPRLLDGKIYNDRRQWEGWMRTARMLEKNVGINSLEAIAKLPEAQLQMYRSKYPA